MTKTTTKGVYNLNPTSAVMKLGAEEQREANARGPVNVGNRTRMPAAHEAAADFERDGGVEEQVHSLDHPAMKTRHSHPHNMKHADGRRHEDDHHAVKMLKGMK